MRILGGIAHSSSLLDRYRPVRFDGNVLYFSAVPDEEADTDGGVDGWRDTVSGTIDLVPVPAGHREMTSPKGLAVIGPALDRYLRDRERAR